MSREIDRAARDAFRQILLDRIKEARRGVAEAEEVVADAVQEARMYGVTWERIATLFPVSRGTLVRIYDPEAMNESHTERASDRRAMKARRQV